jgi:hypothetical protein
MDDEKYEQMMNEIFNRSGEGCANILAYICGYMKGNKEFQEAFDGALLHGLNVE